MFIKHYYDVSVSRCGIRTDIICDKRWGARFKFDTDTRRLFPYINRRIPRARYTLKPLCIRFGWKGIACTLYPEEAVASSFKGRNHAYAFIEDLMSFLNELHDRRDQIPPNHKVHRKPLSVLEIFKILPRTNCGVCGYPTCMAFAAALSRAKTLPDHCPGFAEPISLKAVYPVLGRDGTVESTLAIEIDRRITENADSKQKEPPKHPESTSQPTEKEQLLLDNHGYRIRKQLTPRELQVLRLVADGSSNPEISKKMGISHHTVKSHVLHIFNKINTNDRTQAAVWAVRNNVI